MEQSGKMKTKKRRGMIISGIFAFLALSFIGLTIWTGQIGLGWLDLCQKPDTPFLWLFKWDEKTKSLHALGNDSQICGFRAGPKAWRPFALRAYKNDSEGMCLPLSNMAIYNFKQGASGLGGSYRLDIIEHSPFFQTSVDQQQVYSDPKNYCDDTAAQWCHVILVPVCRTSEKTGASLTICHTPDIRADANFDIDYGPTGPLAAVMMANQKGWGEGFRYSLVEDSAPLRGGLAIAQGLRGEVRCYYQQTQYESVDKTYAATHDQAVQTCMNVLTDRTHYCRGADSLPSFREF